MRSNLWHQPANQVGNLHFSSSTPILIPQSYPQLCGRSFDVATPFSLHPFPGVYIDPGGIPTVLPPLDPSTHCLLSYPHSVVSAPNTQKYSSAQETLIAIPDRHSEALPTRQLTTTTVYQSKRTKENREHNTSPTNARSGSSI